MEGGISTAQSVYPAACLIVAQNKCLLFQFLELKEALRPYFSGMPRRGVLGNSEGIETIKRVEAVRPLPF